MVRTRKKCYSIRSPEEGPSARAGPSTSGGSGHIASDQWRGSPRDPRRGEGDVLDPETASAPTPAASTSSRRIRAGTHRSDNAPPAQRVLPVSQPATTKAGLPRQRMKWTKDMNEHILRCYYVTTDMERNFIGHRKLMHKKFIDRFPDYAFCNEQRISDQRRVIMRNNLIAPPTMSRIRQEAERELQENASTGNDPNNCNDNETSPRDELERSFSPPDTNATNDNARFELTVAFNEFEGSDPLKRPYIPRINSSRRLYINLTAVNQAISEKIQERSEWNLENIHLLVYCGAIAVCRLMGLKIMNVRRPTVVKKMPRWHSRLSKKVSELRVDIGRLTVFLNGTESRRVKLKVRHIMNKAGYFLNSLESRDLLVEHLDTLKQKLAIYAARIARYTKSYRRKIDIREFEMNQKRFYSHLGNSNGIILDPPNLDNIEKYWRSLWSTEVDYNSDAEWIQSEMTNSFAQMEYIQVTDVDVKDVLIKSANWKMPGPDNLQNFWYKKFTSVHSSLSKAINFVIEKGSNLPEFLSVGRTTLLAKNEQTRDPSNYRPIACLPALYKIITGIIATKIRLHAEANNILAEEQKGCQRGSMGCKEQLVIDSIVSKQAQCMQRNIWMAYIDFKKAFDSPPHTWLIDVLKAYKIHPLVISFLQNVMKSWKTELVIKTSRGSLTSSKISIKRGIFQGDTLSPIWFCLAMNPLSRLLNESLYGFKIKNRGRVTDRISHLIYIDDVKLYSDTTEHLQNLVDIVEMFCRDVRMELGINKCKAVCLERGVLKGMNPLGISEGRKIEFLRNSDFYKYLGVRQTGSMPHVTVRKELSEEYLKRVNLVLRTQLGFANKIKALNTFAVPVLLYSFGIINWSRTSIDEIAMKTRVLLTKHGMRHPKAAVERITLSPKMGGYGILDFHRQMGEQIKSLREYFYSKRGVRYKAIIEADLNYTPLNLSNREMDSMRGIQTLEQTIGSWSTKALHGRHCNEISQSYVDIEASNRWLTCGGIYAETVGFMVAIQDQVIATKNYKRYILQDETVTDDKCRRCFGASESIQHITAGCSQLAVEDYIERHDHVAKIVHIAIATSKGLIKKNDVVPYYKYNPVQVLENEGFRLYWNRTVLTDKTIVHNRPDIVLVDSVKKETYFVEISIPNTGNLEEKWKEKIRKYQELALEVTRVWGQNYVKVVPVIISSTGVVPQALHESLKLLCLEPRLYEKMQKAVVLDTTRLVRKFLGGSQTE